MHGCIISIPQAKKKPKSCLLGPCLEEDREKDEHDDDTERRRVGDGVIGPSAILRRRMLSLFAVNEREVMHMHVVTFKKFILAFV